MTKYLGRYYTTKPFQKVLSNGEKLVGKIYCSRFSNDYAIVVNETKVIKCYYSKSKCELIQTATSCYGTNKLAMGAARNYVILRSKRKYNEKFVLSNRK